MTKVDKAVGLTARQLAMGSLLLGLLVFGLKLAAFLVTDSVALLSDALESLVNIVAAIAVIVALRVAERPADENHPYGHHKAEYFAAVLEGVMIALAALAILWSAVPKFAAPEPVNQPVLGLTLNLLAAALNGGWALLLVRRGTAMKSPALVADGRHLWTDVITSFGVAVGVALAAATGWLMLDPLIASAIGLHVLFSGWKVVQGSMGGLMDEALSPAEMDQLRAIIQSSGAGAIEAHDIHTRQAGAATFIEFHLVVDGAMSVTASHELCDQIELAVKVQFAPCRVHIHVEPDHKAKSEGILLNTD